MTLSPKNRAADPTHFVLLHPTGTDAGMQAVAALHINTTNTSPTSEGSTQIRKQEKCGTTHYSMQDA